MKHLTNDEYSGVVYIEDNNNENRFTVGSHIVYSDNGEDDNGTLVDLTVDLGVPDYKYKHFYLMMKTANKNSEIQFRRSLMELKDF